MLKTPNSAEQIADRGHASPLSDPFRFPVAIPASEAANVVPSQNPVRNRNPMFFNLSNNAYASINNVSAKFLMISIISTVFVIRYFESFAKNPDLNDCLFFFVLWNSVVL